MFYDAVARTHGLKHDPFKALVSPRPIGWIGSKSPEGVLNLAPYSFFNAFSSYPYIVGFGSEGYKHSIANIEATGAFSCSMAVWDLRDQMNISSGAVAADVDEFKLAGLTPVQCEMVDAPRVGEAPAARSVHIFGHVRGEAESTQKLLSGGASAPSAPSARR